MQKTVSTTTGKWYNRGKVKLTVEECYAKIAPKLTNYLVANGCDYAEACDVVQETFLRLWKMRDDLIDDATQVSGLVYTIARNYRNDLIRKARRVTLQEEIADADAGSVGPAASPSDADYLRRRLAGAFAKLPPLLREAYTLFQIMELPIAEIARRTQASENLVKVRIFRAKEKLRPLLKDLL